MTPAEYDEATLHAFRAFKDGKASDGQQAIVLEHILINLCRIRHVSFDANNDRQTAFNEGARFVGLQIAGMFDPKADGFTKEARANAAPVKRQRRTKQEAKND